MHVLLIPNELIKHCQDHKGYAEVERGRDMAMVKAKNRNGIAAFIIAQLRIECGVLSVRSRYHLLQK